MASKHEPKHESKLHYSKPALEKEYTHTFRLLMWALVIGIGGALAYFFAMATYLGGWSHTPSAPYINTFADRIQYEYKGTKLPMYENPAAAEKFTGKESQQ